MKICPVLLQHPNSGLRQWTQLASFTQDRSSRQQAERHTRTGIGLPLLSCRNASSGPHWTCADLRPSLTAYVRLQVEHSSLDCKAIKAYLFHIAARLHSPTSCHEPWTAVCKMGYPSWRSTTRAHELLHERRLNSRHPPCFFMRKMADTTTLRAVRRQKFDQGLLSSSIPMLSIHVINLFLRHEKPQPCSVSDLQGSLRRVSRLGLSC